jgi:hypothetical protein
MKILDQDAGQTTAASRVLVVGARIQHEVALRSQAHKMLA